MFPESTASSETIQTFVCLEILRLKKNQNWIRKERVSLLIFIIQPFELFGSKLYNYLEKVAGIITLYTKIFSKKYPDDLWGSYQSIQSCKSPLESIRNRNHQNQV